MKTQTKTQLRRWNAALALGGLALLGASLSPARAQDAGAPADNGKPISLNLINVPVQTALRTLFSSAGIRNYSIDPNVQGYANINVSDVPFSLALRQLLSSGNPPLTFSLVDGVYQVKVQTAVAPPAVTVAQNNTDVPPSTANQPKRYYVIPVDSYDAYYIATLVGQAGIIEVEPNYPAGGSQGGQNGQQNGQGGNRGGFGGNRGGGGFGGGLSTPVTTIGGGTGGFGGSTGGFGGGFGGGRGY